MSKKKVLKKQLDRLDRIETQIANLAGSIRLTQQMINDHHKATRQHIDAALVDNIDPALAGDNANLPQIDDALERLGEKLGEKLDRLAELLKS